MARFVRIVVAVAATLVVCAPAGAEKVEPRGDKPVLAVVPFTGPQSKLAEAAVVRTLRKKATIVPPTTWNKSANKLFAHTHSPDDISAVAEDVGAQVVITGIVRRDGRRWELSVGVRSGKTGKTTDRLRYPLKGPRVTAATLETLTKEVNEAFDSAVAAAEGAPEKQPEQPPPTANPQPPTTSNPPSANGNEAELAPVQAHKTPEPAPAPPATPTRRPRWAPYFDADVGAMVSGRSFDFDPASQPKFTSGVVAGIRGDLTLYPLAFTWNKAHGVFSGLGLGATVDKPFWPDSTSKQDPTQKFATNELRVEGGLRWRIVLYKPIPRPQLLLSVGGGLHNFAIGKDATGQDVGPADVSYKYLTVGGGMRIHFAEFAWLWAMFDYHVVFDPGPIANTAAEYGPAKTYGIRVRGGLNFFVYKGLKLGADGFYERFHLTFDPANTMPAKVANSGTDQYFGGVIVVGYVL